MIVKEVFSKAAIVKSKLPSADYVVNAYTGCTHKCVYCYAEFMKRFTNHREDWGDFIDVKIFDTVKLPRNIEGKYIFISSVTDPYNHFEMKYRKTREILEVLKNVPCHVGILTKSKNVLMDMALFQQFQNIEIGVSMNSIDDNFRKLTEPNASTVEERINILKTLKENNIKNYLFVSPIFPYLTDFKTIIERTKDYVDYYAFENLNLRSGYKSKVLEFIKRHYRTVFNGYADIYQNGRSGYWDELEREIVRYCEHTNIHYKMFFHHERNRK